MPLILLTKASPYVLVLAIKGHACHSTIVNEKVAVCGWIESEGKPSGFVALVKDKKVEWFTLIKEVYELRKTVVLGDKLIVCGSRFIGSIKLSNGNLEWSYSSGAWLNDLAVLPDGKIFVCGVGYVALLDSSGKIIAEKAIEVVRSDGTSAKPFLFSLTVIEDRVVLAGAVFNVLSSSSGLDCLIVCMSIKDLKPLWAKCFGGKSHDRLYGVCSENGLIYVTGHTISRILLRQETIVACFSTSGEIKWCKVLFSKKWSYGASIVSIKAVYVIGLAEGYGTEKTVFIAKISPKSGSLLDSYEIKLGKYTTLTLGSHAEEVSGGVLVSCSNGSPLVIYWPLGFKGSFELEDKSDLVVEKSAFNSSSWNVLVKEVELSISTEKVLFKKSFQVSRITVGAVKGGKLPVLEEKYKEKYLDLRLILVALVCIAIIVLFLYRKFKKS